MGLLKYKYRLDNLWVGFSIGLALPAIFMAIVFAQEAEFVKFMMTSLLRISLILNLAVFLLTFNFEWDKFSRGVLMATILYGLVIVYFYLAE